MTLARHYDGEAVTGWLASEKLDGCRAYWDGSRLWTRGGNVIEAPAWFTRDLPARVHLDGEVYAGRGRFEEARLAVQNGRFTRRCRFVAFDAPNVSAAWPVRRAAAGMHCETVRPWRVESMRQLNIRLRAIQARGGEGVVLRNPAVLAYETGRTRNLLKFLSPTDADDQLLPRKMSGWLAR